MIEGLNSSNASVMEDNKRGRAWEGRSGSGTSETEAPGKASADPAGQARSAPRRILAPFGESECGPRIINNINHINNNIGLEL